MLTGLHAIVYAEDAGKARAFFRDVLKFPAVDAGQGWLIFALPPAEMGVHPVEDGAPGMNGRQELYLMCDDVQKTVAELKGKGVEFTAPIADRGWGILTTMRIPGGGDLHLYQPRHPTAIKAARSTGKTKAKKSTKKAAKKKAKPAGKKKAKASGKRRR